METDKAEPSRVAHAAAMLHAHRIMAISTLRPDGWPQNTIVGYANNGLRIYFLTFRTSQKFSNIENDDRVSIAIGEEPRDIREIRAVMAGAHAFEVTDEREREFAWRLLMKRHPNLRDSELPDRLETAMMAADCRYLSLLDYTKGFGHSEALTIDSAEA